MHGQQEAMERSRFDRWVATGRRAGVTAGLLASVLATGSAQAECLGLDLPTPQETNVCETLLEDLLVPAGTGLFCDVPWYTPLVHCHLPGACHVDPTCLIFEKTYQTAGYLLNAGDLYCDPREVEPEEVIEKLGQQLYTDVITLTSGGVSSLLYTVANAQIDYMECSADAIPGQLKVVVDRVLAETGVSESNSFFDLDVDRVRILDRSAYSMGETYLQPGYGAITLDSLVVIQDHLHAALVNWDHSWDEVKFGQLNVVEERALSLLIHELTHVRQYREAGREQFVNQYLAEALVYGYGDISTEEEADSVQHEGVEAYGRLRGRWDAIASVIL